jgi:arsenate reductase (thioredoxin)
MQGVGFAIEQKVQVANLKYNVNYSPDGPTIAAWSKRFDDAANPTSGFCSIMTCSDADNNCPFVAGAEMRIPIIKMQ